VVVCGCAWLCMFLCLCVRVRACARACVSMHDMCGFVNVIKIHLVKYEGPGVC